MNVDQRETHAGIESNENQVCSLANEAAHMLNTANTGEKRWSGGCADLSRAGMILPVLEIFDGKANHWKNDSGELKQSSGLNEALDSGKPENLEKVLAGVASRADYEQVQRSVTELNRNAPEGVSYSLKMNKDHKPELHIKSDFNNPSFGERGHESYDLYVTDDSMKAYHRTAFGIVPRNEIDPGYALSKVQDTYQH